jgi:hypothetical protein
LPTGSGRLSVEDREDRVVDGAGAERADLIGRRREVAAGEGDEGIAVDEGVRGLDRAGDAAVSALGEQQTTGLVETGVGGEDSDRGVGGGTEVLGPAALGQRPSAGGLPAWWRSPKALTTINAATMRSPARIEAVPMPPGRTAPWNWPTVAPVPAPTLPVGTGPGRALAQAA